MPPPVRLSELSRKFKQSTRWDAPERRRPGHWQRPPVANLWLNSNPPRFDTCSRCRPNVTMSFRISSWLWNIRYFDKSCEWSCQRNGKSVTLIRRAAREPKFKQNQINSIVLVACARARALVTVPRARFRFNTKTANHLIVLIGAQMRFSSWCTA